MATDFSVIAQTPEMRALVQEKALQREFHDSLFPALVFRSEAEADLWPGEVGDEQIFTGDGLIEPNTEPTPPMEDPEPATYGKEQWNAVLRQWTNAIDTHMPTSSIAIANIFLRNAKKLGLAGAQSINRVARNTMYNAARAGWTMADGSQASSVTLRVLHLNGLTRGRNPNTTGASKVRFDPVSSTNPLEVTIEGVTGTRNIIDFTPDTPGDEVGPGTVTLSAVTGVTVADRAYVWSYDRTATSFVGGGNKADDVSSTDLPKLSDFEAAVARLWDMNVPEHGDGRFHCHLDGVSIAKCFQDEDLKRLTQSMPDYYMYKKMALGEILNTVFVRNNECPAPSKVATGEKLALQTANASGVGLRHILIMGSGGLMEYYADQSEYVSEAGLNGKIAEPKISNNSIEVGADYISLIFRAPMDRLQSKVSVAYRYVGSFVMRTDAATGDDARYKRAYCITHGT